MILLGASRNPVQITVTVHSVHHCFIRIRWLKVVYNSLQGRNYNVCSGSSNQHPGNSLPWVTPVSDTLSAAYMPPTPLCFTHLCVLSLCPCYVLSCLLFSLRIVSLLFCSLPGSPALNLFYSVLTLLLPPPVFLFQLALFKTLLLLPYPPLSTLRLILAFPSYSLSHD